MKKILVLGSNSFAGSCFINFILTKKFQVIGISRSGEKNKNEGIYFNNKNIPIVERMRTFNNEVINIDHPLRYTATWLQNIDNLKKKDINDNLYYYKLIEIYLAFLYREKIISENDFWRTIDFITSQNKRAANEIEAAVAATNNM